MVHCVYQREQRNGLSSESRLEHELTTLIKINYIFFAKIFSESEQNYQVNSYVKISLNFVHEKSDY